ncbi:MAG: tRNA (5-methylaminomethyl-2-thiouridylate)-methyltransferase [Gammaproteobacteria bacterium]|nr:tRNA (5-methylaminomethyl-2-thiouridylate)-methyltransferase [Gammaproteobacteria bacterium]
MLAARVLQQQGVHVEGLNFFTGFCVEGHTHSIRKRESKTPRRNNALWVAEQLGIKLHIIDVAEEYKDVVINPKHGYGSNLNPCLDCKGFMVRKATHWMAEHDFDFVATGEVIGQRPMSQRKATMPVIARESGANDRLVRPLSAQLLPPTYPEQQGWLKRDQLYDFSGRGRKPQIALAQQFGFDEWAQPAGGCCFLTDQAYSRKLADLWSSRGEKNYELDDIMLLKVGRHIRPRPHFKLIVSREEGENNFLRGYRKRFISLEPVSHEGALALLDGDATNEELKMAAEIVARYSQGRAAATVSIRIRDRDSGEEKTIDVAPLQGEIPSEWRI